MEKRLFYLSISILLIGNLGCNPTKHIGENEYLLHKVKFIVEGEVDREEIGAIIKQQPNRKLLGISRFHLGVYNLFDREKLNLKIEKKEKKLLAKNKRRITK